MRIFIENLAKTAGITAMEYFSGKIANQVFSKSTQKDLVSEADRAVETQIINAIRTHYPEHGIFGEESGKDIQNSPYCWVIDPIDGTQSFVRRHPYFSISIALKYQNKAIAGAVYAPALGMMFSAEQGCGAFENGQRIYCTQCLKLEEASLATGFGCLRANLPVNNLKYFNMIAPLARDIKRCGSAALNLCFVASGRYDASWELFLQEYDVAAGALIASEAGAAVSDLHGSEDFPKQGIIAGNHELVKILLPFFK